MFTSHTNNILVLLFQIKSVINFFTALHPFPHRLRFKSTLDVWKPSVSWVVSGIRRQSLRSPETSPTSKDYHQTRALARSYRIYRFHPDKSHCGPTLLTSFSACFRIRRLLHPATDVLQHWKRKKSCHHRSPSPIQWCKNRTHEAWTTTTTKGKGLCLAITRCLPTYAIMETDLDVNNICADTKEIADTTKEIAITSKAKSASRYVTGQEAKAQA